MATTAQDNLVKPIGFDVRKINYNLDSSGSNDFNQGDMVYLDTTNNYIKALNSDANAANYVGVALKSEPLQLYVRQVDNTVQKNYDAQALVAVAGVFFFKTTAGETYKDGTALYIGADAQTVTTVAGSNQVGTAKMRPGQTSVTGAAGTNVDVQIVVQFPVKSS